MSDFGDPYEQSGNHDEEEAVYAEGRRVDRTYVSRSFPAFGTGVPARFVCKVFDREHATELQLDGEEWLVRESPKGRVQVKLLVTREPGHISELWIQRINRSGRTPRADTVLSLSGQEAQVLAELFRNLDLIPIDGPESVRVDDDLIREIFSHPDSLVRLYRRDPEQLRKLIADDDTSRDVVAMAGRRAQVARFKQLLEDDEFFDAEAASGYHGRPEAVWQAFFEQNPWILGAGLGGQLLTSWNHDKLEQIVAGHSVAGPGRRVDALMRTSGIVRWMTFAEFKVHRTSLLGAQPRPGVWAPSQDLVGGVEQLLSTVQQAVTDLGEVLQSRDHDGALVQDDTTFLVRPRSYLVIGHLGQLMGAGGGPHPEKIRCFELFRRNLVEPEVVTYDELLARAEWLVDTHTDAETGASGLDQEDWSWPGSGEDSE